MIERTRPPRPRVIVARAKRLYDAAETIQTFNAVQSFARELVLLAMQLAQHIEQIERPRSSHQRNGKPPTAA